MNKHILGKVQLSTRCNQECLFCSVPRGPEENPSFEEIQKRIKELKRQGTTDLFITGGEPTIHPHFFDILNYVKSIGFDMISIQTNGSNLTRQVLRAINHLGNVRLNVSIHTHEKQTAEKLSRTEHFDQFVEGMKRVDAMKIPAFFTIVINSFNYKNLKDLIIFINKNFPSIRHFSFNYIDPTGIATEHAYLVPRLEDVNDYLQQTMSYIVNNGMSFRLERAPLCYMKGFEEFSTEARLRAFEEKRLTYFAYENKEENEHLMIERDTKYVKTLTCNDCTLKELCSGLNPNYVKIHGVDEIKTPSTTPEKEVIERIKNSKDMGESKVEAFRQRVVSDLDYFLSFANPSTPPSGLFNPGTLQNRLKFIEKQLAQNGYVSRKDYKSMFGKDIFSEFPYAIRALKILDFIQINPGKIVFKELTPGELKAGLLFFSKA